jgi:hypothetical protein
MKFLLRKLGWIAQRRRKEAELREELAFHLAEEADERKTSGLSEQDARLAARRDLGSVALIAEDTRSTWGWIWIERVGQDVRYAFTASSPIASYGDAARSACVLLSAHSPGPWNG